MTTSTRVSKKQMPAAWQKQWRLDRELGRPRQVSADRARAHVQALMASGWTLRAIGEEGGLSASTLEHLLRRNRLVRVTTERKLLAIRPRQILQRTNPAGFVPALGARRRIRALMALGWTHAAMREHCGVLTSVALNQRGEFLAKATYDAIAAMFEELCMTPGPSPRGRARAAAAGYAPPLAWDDIDDPAEQPELGQPESRSGGRPGASLDEWLHLVRGGEDVERAARRLGVTVMAIEQAAYRHGRADVMRLLGIDYEARSAERVSAA